MAEKAYKQTDGQLVQQTYAAAFGVFEQFDIHSDFNKWLNEILRRTCLRKGAQVES
jgi:DNA-directed RNA polymerase specialized sigma24 family protein